jgi:Recombinase/Recombinase zinc beta ribbon domain
MFEQARNGRGMHGIAKELNGRGVPTGGMPGHNPAYYWQHAYIGKILRNAAVLGTFTPHVGEVVDGKRRRRALNPVLNYFPAIVDAGTFQAVQARLATVQARGRHANTGPAHLFAGLLRCPHCAGTVTRVKKPDAAYLICAKANSKGGCKRLPVLSADVEYAFLQQLPTIPADAPRSADTADLEAEASALAVNLDVCEMDERDLVEELMDAPPAARAALRDELAQVAKRNSGFRGLCKTRWSGGTLCHQRGCRPDWKLSSRPYRPTVRVPALTRYATVALPAAIRRSVLRSRASTSTPSGGKCISTGTMRATTRRRSAFRRSGCFKP